MMEIVEQIKFICFIFLLIPIPLTIWQLCVGLCGIRKSKETPSSNKRFRFALLVCAKDEQEVIGQLVDSLNAQNYDKDKFKVFVVADNCSDNTAKVASEHGATVFERFNETQRGKGYALSWVFKKLSSEYKDNFDAFAIFDADNLVHPDFLLQTNNALQNGADITQGYRDTKNPYDSVVSGCYSIYWLVLMRLFHCARGNIGLSCMVGGTGFAFKAELVKDGFESRTMTEDIEFALNQIIKGRKIVPVREAVFYDEQPTDFKTSLTQRFRWLVGNLQCASYILPKTIKEYSPKNLSANQKLSVADAIIYMVSTYAMPFATIFSAIYFSASIMLSQENYLFVIKDSLIALAISFLLTIIVAFATVLLEHKSLKKYFSAILFFPLFILPLSVMSVVAIIPRKIEWKQIKHTCIKEIDDVTNYANVA